MSWALFPKLPLKCEKCGRDFDELELFMEHDCVRS